MIVLLARAVDGTRGSAWAPVTTVFGTAGLATAAVLQAVDGIALKTVVDLWSDAGEDRSSLFAAAWRCGRSRSGWTPSSLSCSPRPSSRSASACSPRTAATGCSAPWPSWPRGRPPWPPGSDPGALDVAVAEARSSWSAATPCWQGSGPDLVGESLPADAGIVGLWFG
jgi:hypothetical protein